MGLSFLFNASFHLTLNRENSILEKSVGCGTSAGNFQIEEKSSPQQCSLLISLIQNRCVFVPSSIRKKGVLCIEQCLVLYTTVLLPCVALCRVLYMAVFRLCVEECHTAVLLLYADTAGWRHCPRKDKTDKMAEGAIPFMRRKALRERMGHHYAKD